MHVRNFMALITIAREIHPNRARVNSLQNLKNLPIFSVSLENEMRYTFEINVVLFRLSVQNSLEKTRPLNVQVQPQKFVLYPLEIVNNCPSLHYQATNSDRSLCANSTQVNTASGQIAALCVLSRQRNEYSKSQHGATLDCLIIKKWLSRRSPIPASKCAHRRENPRKYCQSKSAHQGLRYSTLNMGSFALPRAITRGNVPRSPLKIFSGFQGVRGFFWDQSQAFAIKWLLPLNRRDFCFENMYFRNENNNGFLRCFCSDRTETWHAARQYVWLCTCEISWPSLQ